MIPFRRALARRPASSFADGLTTADLGPPDLAAATTQHEAYCEALRRCGLEVTVMGADPRHPDSAFVEDTAVLTPSAAILARPGAPSRMGEVAPIRDALGEFFTRFRVIEPPGTLDGGDVCEAGGRYFIGISERTNDAGARQLAAFLSEEGYESTFVDVRGMEDLLHLKSGLACVDDRTLVARASFAEREEFIGWRILRVDPDEAYAANCVRVNDGVILPAGFPKTETSLRGAGLRPVPVEMSEFRKMDGGPSCLSLRF